MNQQQRISYDLADAQERHTAKESAGQAVQYRIYTQHMQTLRNILDTYFDGYNVVYARGVYKGTEEHAAIIEIIGTRADFGKIETLARDIKVINGQDSVLVTWQPVQRLDV